MIVQRIRDADTLQRLSYEKDRADQKCRELEETLVIALQAIRRLEQEEQRKPVLIEEEEIDFFPQWKPQQGVIGETKEEEEYLVLGEDGRSYIAVRRKQG